MEDRDHIRELHARVETLTATVRAQAETIARLTAERETFMSPTIREVHDAYAVSDAETADGTRRRCDTATWKNTTRARLEPLVRLLGDLPAIQLGPRRWKQHVRARQQEAKRVGVGAPAPATLRLELAVAKAMLGWASAEDTGMLKFNPLARARLGKAPRRRTWLNEQQVAHLVATDWTEDAWKRDVVRAFTLGSADNGPRSTEVRLWRRDRVTVVDGHAVMAMDRTKGGEPHTVALTARTWEALERLPEVPGSPFFFANPRPSPRGKVGRPIGRVTIWKWFRAAVEAAGLDTVAADGELRVRPHALRRSAATNAHARGASLQDVQEMLAHANISTTAGYVQRTPASAIKMARLMETGAAAEMEGARRGPQRVPKEKVRDPLDTMAAPGAT